MSEGRRKILDMLSERKITTNDAERLLAALDKPQSSGANSPGGDIAHAGLAPKYLRVVVEKLEDGSRKPTKVNVRVPLQLLRAQAAAARRTLAISLSFGRSVASHTVALWARPV